MKNKFGWSDVTISDVGPLIQPVDLLDFEHLVGCKLPDGYKQFLLQHNGGLPSPWCAVPISVQGESPNQDIQVFFGIGRGPEDLTFQVESMRKDYGRQDLIPIAITSGGKIYVILVSAEEARVYLFDPWDPDALVAVAKSFEEFLSLVYMPEWWDESNE